MSLRDPQYRAAIDLLSAARRRSGVTQAQLAESLGKPQSFVSKFERFERRLDIAEYVRIANAVGLDPDEGCRALGWKGSAK